MDPVVIPIVSVTGFFLWMISLSPVGKAWAERLRRPMPGALPDAREREELLSAVEELRREVAELAERVDFTERLLAKQGSQPRVSP